MSEHTATIGSMFGFHIGELPEVTYECREADKRHDKASCAMCQALIKINLWEGHEDLGDIPEVQSAVTEMFMELMTKDFESFSCPFPETDKCRSLRRLKRPSGRR